MNVNEAMLRFTARRESLNFNALVRYEEAVQTNPQKAKPKRMAEEFKFMHCYDVLKETPVFNNELLNQVNKKRKRQKKSSAPQFGSPVSNRQQHASFLDDIDPSVAFRETNILSDDDAEDDENGMDRDAEADDVFAREICDEDEDGIGAGSCEAPKTEMKREKRKMMYILCDVNEYV